MDLKKAILNTLFYHAVFNFPLKESEIYYWLYQFGDKKVSKSRLKKSLGNLVKNNKINKKSNYYYPKKSNIKDSDLTKRVKKEKYSSIKINKAKKAAKVFSYFPWVRMIAISGNVAMNNAFKEDDIDLMIITKNKRLWLTRLIIVSFLKLFGLRPVLGENKKNRVLENKLCVNLWLDQSSLKIKQKNVFTAHEILALKPILNKNKTYERFIWFNSWAFSYWPNVLSKPQEKFSKQIKTKKPFWDKLNKIAYKAQVSYMKPKIKNEKIGLHFAFFHRIDRSEIIMLNFKKISI